MEINNDYFLNSQGQLIWYARYKEQDVADYQGNPLIEALPAIISYEEAAKRLLSYPPIGENERSMPSHIRYHLVLRLSRFFQPWAIHTDLEEKISSIIRQGYISRNPLGPDYARTFRTVHQAIDGYGIYPDSTPYIQSTATTLSIIGVSGVGKTSSIERVLSLYPQTICHQTYDERPFNQYQITWLKLECPHDGSVKALCSRFFTEMDRLLDENYFEKYGTGRLTTDVMIPRMETLAHRHHLGLLVIDEIQHLMNAKYASSNQMMDFFTSLVNTVRVPIVLIGTNKAVELLRNSLRHARRATGNLGVIYFKALQKGYVWDLLVDGLWGFQWTSEESALTDEIRDALYEHSQGIIDIAVKLYIGAQTLAIKTGYERITPDLIHIVAEQYQLFLKDIMVSLQGNDLEKMSRYDDIMPPDLQDFITQLENESSSLKKRLLGTTQAKKKKLENSAASLPEILPRKIEACEEEDLRYIADRARREGSSVYEAIERDGYIRNPLDELI